MSYSSRLATCVRSVSVYEEIQLRLSQLCTMLLIKNEFLWYKWNYSFFGRFTVYIVGDFHGHSFYVQFFNEIIIYFVVVVIICN